MEKSAAVRQNNLLDFRGIMSFVGLLELSKKFDEMKSGQVLEILIRDKGTISDIFKLLPRTSYKMTIREINSSLNRIRIKKYSAIRKKDEV